jgi:hypothetical protein
VRCRFAGGLRSSMDFALCFWWKVLGITLSFHLSKMLPCL